MAETVSDQMRFRSPVRCVDVSVMIEFDGSAM